MGLETATYISDLVATNPVGATDDRSTADDHIRLLKDVLQNSFPNITGEISATQDELNLLAGASSDVGSVLGAADFDAIWALLLASADPDAIVSLLDNLPHGQCELSLDGSDLLLSPLNGNKIIINGAMETIPSAGVSLSISTESASTLYYIYAYMNSGTMTLESSTTGHSVDATTGVEIKTGDSTRTLVGMAYTNATPAWQDDANHRYVRSWFNDKGIFGSASAATSVTTTSTTPYLANSEPRVHYISWDGEKVRFRARGGISTTTASPTSDYVHLYSCHAKDGTSTLSSGHFDFHNTGDSTLPNTAMHKLEYEYIEASEGYHYSDVMVWTGVASCNVQQVGSGSGSGFWTNVVETYGH